MTINIEPELTRLTDSLQITFTSLLGKSRKPLLVRIRYCVWAFLETNKQIPRKHLAEFFNKNRSTVQYGIESANFRRQFWPEYISTYKLITSYLERKDEKMVYKFRGIDLNEEESIPSKNKYFSIEFESVQDGLSIYIENERNSANQKIIVSNDEIDNMISTMQAIKFGICGTAKSAI